MVTDYLSVGGEVLAETRWGVERDYVPDPLGSTSALLGPGGAAVESYGYWPYGEETTQGGSTPLRFVGTLGYRTDEPSARAYVRARHYRPGLARWQTVDPLWPGESAYGYAGENPTTWTDPSGLLGCTSLALIYNKGADCPAALVQWTIAWSARPGEAGAKGGFIVQRIENAVETDDCCGNNKDESFPPFGKRGRLSRMEAFAPGTAQPPLTQGEIDGG